MYNGGGGHKRANIHNNLPYPYPAIKIPLWYNTNVQISPYSPPFRALPPPPPPVENSWLRQCYFLYVFLNLRNVSSHNYHPILLYNWRKSGGGGGLTMLTGCAVYITKYTVGFILYLTINMIIIQYLVFAGSSIKIIWSPGKWTTKVKVLMRYFLFYATALYIQCWCIYWN